MKFDVMILGSGVTGLSTLYHLRQRGVHRVALLAPHSHPSASHQAAGWLSGSLMDNFSRLNQAHGPVTAGDFWRFANLAFDRLNAFAMTAGTPPARRARLRLITSDHELREAEAATHLAAAAGITDLRLWRRPELTEAMLSRWGLTAGSFTDRVLAVQDDGDRGAFLESSVLLAALAAAAGSMTVARFPAAGSLDVDHRGARATCEDGQQVEAELAVVAAHLQLGVLVPELAPALVSVADQWLQLTPAGTAVALPPGLAFTANHSHEWGVVTSAGELRLGGARYLRPLGGLEATTASIEPKVTARLAALANATWSLPPAWEAPIKVTASLDCRPCDELPLIGPMFGRDRLLVATGYMGNGLTMGFLAGACLAELITTGQSPALPRMLWPERLRSLEA